MNDDERTSTSRRTILKASGLALATTTAGCSGAGDGNGGGDGTGGGDGGNTGGSGGDGGSGGGGGGRLTVVDGPDGEGRIDFRLQHTDREDNAIDEFQSLVVSFDRLTLVGDGEVTVELDGELDFTASDPGELVPLLDGLAVPTGSYATLELYATVEKAVRTDGSDSAPFELSRPATFDLDFTGEAMSVKAGSTVQFTINMTPTSTFEGDGWRFLTGFGYR